MVRRRHNVTFFADSDDVHPSKHKDYMGISWKDMLSSVDLEAVKKELLAAIAAGKDTAQKTLALSLNQVIVMVATKAGWHKRCHVHPSDAHLTVLQGRFVFKIHTSSRKFVLDAGDLFLVPKWHPHEEGTYGIDTAVFLVRWSPTPDKAHLTMYVSKKECNSQQFPVAKLPSLEQTQPSFRPILPEEWSATAFLHPFSPPQTGKLDKDNLFTQLGIATFSYSSKLNLFFIKVQGCKGERRLYKMDDKDTYIWKDGKWTKVDMGWEFPNRDWLGSNAVYAGSSPLNWMNEDKVMAWWKQPHDTSATWFWYDKTGAPFRIMFGTPPPSILKGDKTKLAFFQMFSFTYIVNFKPVFMVSENIFNNKPIQSFGLECGNPDSFKPFNWTSYFAMSAMMVPVDFKSDPLPTQVTYRWEYGLWKGRRTDRLQTTVFYNPGLLSTAALFGGWKGTQHKGDGYRLDSNMLNWTHACEKITAEGIGIGQQPPWWPMLGKAKVLAVIRKPTSAPADWVSPFTGTNRTVAILGVLFPPHLPQYPESTYLWTWYDYTEYSERQGPARPITFMQSASKINEGTSLALADYFQYVQLDKDVYIHMQYLDDTIKETCNTVHDENTLGGAIRGHRLGPHAFFPSLKPWQTEDDIKDYPGEF